MFYFFFCCMSTVNFLTSQDISYPDHSMLLWFFCCLASNGKVRQGMPKLFFFWGVCVIRSSKNTTTVFSYMFYIIIFFIHFFFFEAAVGNHVGNSIIHIKSQKSLPLLPVWSRLHLLESLNQVYVLCKMRYPCTW